MKYRNRHAFTLVELLVVIAIIGILVALLLPAVQAAREAARRLSCTNNLTQLILAVQNYEGAFHVYPSGTSAEKGPILNVAEGKHHNWLIRVLPYFEETNTYNHVDFLVGVYHENNAPVAQHQECLLPGRSSRTGSARPSGGAANGWPGERQPPAWPATVDQDKTATGSVPLDHRGLRL